MSFLLASPFVPVHSRGVSSERNGHAPLPLGLLASLRAAIVAVVLVASLASGLTLAGKTSSSGLHKSNSKMHTPHKTTRKPKVKRSLKAKHDFKHLHPCPSTARSTGSCPGYIIDHIEPLCAGGADAPSNMQWQTIAASKAKDKLERQECSAFPRR